MFGTEAFARMRPGSFFINLARGELVDERALEAALDSGRLAGAGLDVGSGPDQMPAARLAARPDVVATPHIGGTTIAARAHQAMDTARQVAAIAAGRMPEGAVNADAASRPDSRIGDGLPHNAISAAYSLPSWEGQVQTEHAAKSEGEEREAQERQHEDRGHLAARA